MKDYFKTKTWLITALILVIAFGLSSAIVYYEFGLSKNIKITSADAGDNVSGWAWNANTGWISFNSSNCDIDGDLIYEGANEGSPAGSTPAPVDCPTSGAVKNYGVNLSPGAGSFEDFSGYAWSSSVGWISFNRSDTGDPPDNPYKNGNSNDPIARADNNSQVDGWARILSFKPLGVDNGNGWIKLKKSLGGEPDYGVTMGATTPPTVEDMAAPYWSYTQASQSGALNAYLQFRIANSNANSFNGWAWNANDGGGGVGWISFNCASQVCVDANKKIDGAKSCGVGGNCSGAGYSCRDHCRVCDNDGSQLCDNNGDCASGGICIYNNYKVVRGGISSAPSSAYQIIVNTSDSTVGQMIFDSGKCLGANNCQPAGTCDPSKCQIDNGAMGTTKFPLQLALLATSTSLEYNKAYYWWVKVWDSSDVASVLTQYNTGIDKDTPPEADDGNPLTFTTYKHEFPLPIFAYFPAEPSRAEEVKFTATSSQRFRSLAATGDPNAPFTAVPCTDANCVWQWDLPPGAAFKTGYDGTASTTIIIFNSAGAKTVTLTVTDKGDTGMFDDADSRNIPYYSKISILVNVNAKLPKWKEVKPE